MNGVEENQGNRFRVDWMTAGSLIVDLIALAGDKIFQLEFPRPIFCLCLIGFILNFGWIIIAWLENLNRRKEQFYEVREGLLNEYGTKKILNVRKYEHDKLKCLRRYEEERRGIHRTRGVHLLFVGVLILILCISNPENAYAVWRTVSGSQTVADTSTSETEPESAPVPDSVSSTAPASGVSDTSDTQQEFRTEPEEKIPKPGSFRFVLAEPGRKPKFDKKMAAEVFFTDCASDQTLETYINIEINKINNSQKKGIPLSELADEEKNTYYTYTAKEDQFKDKVKAFQNEPYLDDWRQKAPRSDELDAYMSGREKLTEVSGSDGAEGNVELWWKLANDNQYYALEYVVQTQNGDAVFYYYMQSIFCCMEALKYEMDEERRMEIYHYMTMRYKDIAELPSHISLHITPYIEQAQKIYDCLAVYDALIENEEGGNIDEADVTVRGL